MKNIDIGVAFKDNYKDYANYVVKYRSHPNSIDGLRTAHKRLLLMANEICADKFVKTSKLINNCIDKYHPHGDKMDETVSLLVVNGFLEGQGNWNTNAGLIKFKPAASRYTEVKLSELSKRLFFKYIDEVPIIHSEISDEPKSLCAMIPGCFINWKIYTVPGVGSKSTIPSFSLSDIISFIKRDFTGELKPDIGLDITSYDDEIIYGSGIGKIVGKIKYTLDEKKGIFNILQKPLSPHKFNYLLSKLSKLESNISFIDLSVDTTNLEITVTKDKENTINRIKEALTKEYSYSTKLIVFDIDKNCIIDTNCKDMIENTYNIYNQYRITSLQNRIKKLHVKKFENRILLMIKENIQNKKITIETEEQFINDCVNILKYDEAAIRVLVNKYTLKQMLNVKNDIDNIDNKIKETTEMLDNKHLITELDGLLQSWEQYILQKK